MVPRRRAGTATSTVTSHCILPEQEWIGFEVVNHHATEGVAIMRLKDGKIAEYHEVANTATGFVDMNFPPERLAKIVARQGAALKARPAMKRHLAG